MICKCAECGKQFDVLWPQLWRYRREKRYLCSWGCMRIYDKKEAKGEQEAMEEVKIRKKPGRKPKVNTEAEKLELQPGGNYQLSVAEKPAQKKEPESFDGFQVTAVKTELGEYHYDKRFNLIDFRNEDGDEISYTPECWKMFIGEMKKVMQILKVEV